MNGDLVKHNPNPVYLGVTLDQTLSHLPKTDVNLQSQNNVLLQLAGSSWGANTKTLHTSALALCYSVAEYCCPAWLRSSHTASIDSQLNNTIWLISGCMGLECWLHADIINHPQQWLTSCWVVRSSIHRHNNAVGRRLVVGFCGQSASTLCSEKKHPLTFSSISPWVMCRFKQKLQWIYIRNGGFWQCRN